MDETEKGWYIQWVDRDPRLLAMQEAAARRERADLDDEEKQVNLYIYSLPLIYVQMYFVSETDVHTHAFFIAHTKGRPRECTVYDIR